MRNYPHGLDEEILPEDLEIEQEALPDIEEKLNASGTNVTGLLLQAAGETNYSISAYSYALGESPANLTDTLKKALIYYVKSIEAGVLIDPYEFLQILSLAIVLKDKNSIESLTSLDRDRYTNEDVEADEIIYAIVEGLSALSKNDDAAFNRMIKANNPDTLDSKKMARYDRMVFLPILNLLDAANKKDANKFSNALEAREKEFVKFFSRMDEKNDPEALIDINGLALVSLAKEKGLNISDNSVYRPFALTQGA